jgi:tetratricopeptide (TPR) repeat protein
MSINDADNRQPDEELSEDTSDLDAALDVFLNLPPLPAPPHPESDNPFEKRPPPPKRPVPEPLLKRFKERVALSKEAEERAGQLLRRGELAQAEEECRRALSISPKLHGNPYRGSTRALLGEILLAQGRNSEALDCFLQGEHHVIPQWTTVLSTALAYCRLRDLEMSRKLYEDIQKHTVNSQEEDLPGTGGPRTLEASILLARATQAYLQHDYEGALLDLNAAGELAPQNWVIVEQTAQVLDRLDRPDEAMPYYRRAVQLGSDKVSDRARERASEEAQK